MKKWPLYVIVAIQCVLTGFALREGNKWLQAEKTSYGAEVVKEFREGQRADVRHLLRVYRSLRGQVLEGELTLQMHQLYELAEQDYWTVISSIGSSGSVDYFAADSLAQVAMVRMSDILEEQKNVAD